MEAIKNVLFKNWHAMRWLRLALAVAFFRQMYSTSEWPLGIFGLFFLYQAIFNRGCGPSGCKVN